MSYTYKVTEQCLFNIQNKINNLNVELIDIFKNYENKKIYCKLLFKDCNHLCIIRKDHNFLCNNKECVRKRISVNTKIGMQNMSVEAKNKLQHYNTIHYREFYKNISAEQKEIISQKHKNYYWNNRLKYLNAIAQQQRNKINKLELSFIHLLKKNKIPFKHQEVIFDSETNHGCIVDFLIADKFYVNIDGSVHKLHTKQLDDEKSDIICKKQNINLIHLTKSQFNLFISFYKMNKISKWKI